MRNRSDAARVAAPAWRQRAAVAIADGLTDFVLAEASG
jgi:N-acetylmuramoyl-L-alanine amidase